MKIFVTSRQTKEEVVQVIKHKIATPISNKPQRRQLRAGAAKKITFFKKSGQNELCMKKYVFAFPTSIHFLLLTVTYQPHLNSYTLGNPFHFS